jgi:hypothetical protein
MASGKDALMSQIVTSFGVLLLFFVWQIVF